MFLQRLKLGLHEFPEVWFLRFTDQRGDSIREFVGPDRAEAEALLRRRRDQVRDGTYVSPQETVRLLEKRRGRPMDEYLREFCLALAAPRTLESWLLFGRWFGYTPHPEVGPDVPPDGEIQLPDWLETPRLRPVLRHPSWRDNDPRA